jgi:phage terminase large subunit-like protein
LDCHQWRYDKQFGLILATQLVNEHGLDAAEFQQSYSAYNEPIIDFTTQLVGGNVRHGNDPLLGYAAGNVVAKEGPNKQVMPDKHKSKDKIDPMVALFMAHSGIIIPTDGPSGDFYEDNELEYA